MKLFELFATLGLDKTGFDQAIDESVNKGSTAKDKLDKTFGLIKKAVIAAGIAITVNKIGDAFTNMGEKADAIDESSQKLGLSRKAYQEWGYVLSQNGGNIESFGVGMKSLQNAMAQGTNATNAAFKALGLKAKDLKKMSPEDALAATISAFQKMPAGAQKSALALDLFGKQGMELLPTLNMTAEATDTLKKRANDLGLVLSDEAIDAGGKFADNMATLKLGLAAVGTNIIAKLMPTISKLIEKILPLADKFLPKLTTAFVSVLDKVWPLVETGLNFLADALAWVADNIDWLLPVLAALSAAILVLNIVMNANPISLIIIGIAALVAGIVLLIQNFDSVSAWFSGIASWINTNVIIPIANFFSSLWTAISDAAVSTWNAIVTAWDAAGAWFTTNVVAPIANFFTTLWNWVSSKASGAWTFIVGVWRVVSTWFNDTVITPISSAFSAFWLAVSTLFSTLWSWIKGIWEGANTWFNDTVITPLATAFTNFWNGISSAAKDTWDAIVGWIQQAIDDITEFLGLADKASTVHQSSGGTTHGGATNGFATGLRYVPYDNFGANLHKGEAVLPKSEANEWRKGATKQTVAAPTYNVTINAGTVDYAEIDRRQRRMLRDLTAGMVM